MQIQDTFDELARKIYLEINLSKKYNISYGEESITDIVLLQLAKLNNFNLRIIQTRKNLECNQGTDWEWFIGSQKYGWTRFALQAKKCNPKDLNYKSLKHKVGQSPNQELQIDKLKKYSSSNKAIPLYTFYNYNPNCKKAEHWHCRKPFDKELLGWTITPLKNVEIAIKNRGWRNYHKIHSFKENLHMKCLIDCPILLRKFQAKNDEITLFGTEYKKIDKLPSQLIEGNDILLTDSFPEGLYNLQIELFPKRIAILNLDNTI